MSHTINTPPQVFSSECIAAVKEFRRAKPWRGNLEERQDKFTALHNRLCAAYGLKTELHFAADIDPIATEALSRFDLRDENITLHFKLSVVTYFTAIGTARGFNYDQALKWAVTLYRKMFPLSATRHIERDGLLVRRPGQ